MFRAGSRFPVLFSQTITHQLTQSSRFANTKPWPKGDMDKWKKGIYDYSYQHARTKKVAKISLPDFTQIKKTEGDTIDPTYLTTLAKERGVVPHRSWDEKPLVVTCTYEINNPYKPKPEDGKSSLVDNIKDSAVTTYKKVRQRPISKIKEYLQDFNEEFFATQIAPKIYEEAHKVLCDVTCPNDLSQPVDETKLLRYVTEKALPEILFRTDLKVLRWKLVQYLETPKLMHATVDPLMDPSNKFAQVTVRFHTQQTLAIYDRFGRLIAGSENVVKDVLEYVVFENYITNQYGTWRIHGKIIPDWVTPSMEAIPTMVKPSFKE